MELAVLLGCRSLLQAAGLSGLQCGNGGYFVVCVCAVPCLQSHFLLHIAAVLSVFSR